MADDQTGNDRNGAEPGGQPPTGRMRFQDGSTTPREPTLAERRAREQAERREREAERREAEEDERSRAKRKRLIRGAGVTVGVVALVAAGYAVAQPREEVQARCVDEETGVVVDESNCITPASSNGTYYGGGGFYPIFIGGGGRQYRYNYGGSGTIGQRVQGGTSVVPRDSTRVTTPSGKSISRGGLGVSGSSSSGS